MKIYNHEDLEVFQQSFSVAVEIYKLSKHFPREELFSLTDQMRRSSRSVCANISEAFRKRYYPKSFTTKINDAEGEAAETQVWLKFCLHFNFIEQNKYNELMEAYNNILGKLVIMRINSDKWSINH